MMAGFPGSQSLLGLGDGGGESNPPPEEGPGPDLSALFPSAAMTWSVGVLMGGLSADELSESLGMEMWQPGTPHGTIFVVSSFDSNAGTIDLTYITVLGENAPLPGTYGNGVTVEHCCLGGNLNDGVRDPVAIRFAGPFAAVADAARGIGLSIGGIATEYGQIAVDIQEGQATVRRDGVEIWTW
jgi:hypothetical protein